MRNMLLWICGLLKDQEVVEVRAENAALRKSIKSLKSGIERLEDLETDLRTEISSRDDDITELKGEITGLEAVNFGYAIQIKKLQGQEEILRYEILALNESHRRIAFLSEASRREAELEIALKTAEIELASATGVGKFHREKPNGDDDDRAGGFR